MHSSHRRLAFLATFILAFVAACGGSQPPPETTPAPSASPPEPAAATTSVSPASTASASAETPPPPPSAAAEPKKPAWDDLSVDQKREVMKTVVLPGMKTLFQQFDAKRFAEVTCTTCHGKGAKEGTFAMPNPQLPKLDPANNFAKHSKKDPKIVKFMMERVVPEMAKFIGEAPWDPATNQGFGCTNCHTMGK